MPVPLADFVVLQQGRNISDIEKRFNSLKAEEENQDIVCSNCCSPDWTETSKVITQPKGDAYLIQAELPTGWDQVRTNVNLYQDIRETKIILRECLFCSHSYQFIQYGDWKRIKVGESVLEYKENGIYEIPLTKETTSITIDTLMMLQENYE